MAKISILGKMLSIPPAGERREVIFSINKVFPGFLLRRDWDYLCYLLFLVMLILSLCVTALIFSDILLSLDVFISKEEFVNNKTLLFSKSSVILGPLGFILAVVFYLRIRLPVDLQNTKIPYMVGPRYLEAAGKRKWFFTFTTLFFTSIVMIFGSHLPPVILAKHYEMQDSTSFVLVAQIFLILGPAVGAAFFVNSLLLLEKILRWFSKVEGDYRAMKTISKEQW